MLKKNQQEKSVSPVKRSALQNFAKRHFFDVNEVATEFSWEIDIKTG